LADASSPASQVVASYYGAYEDKFQLRPYRPARVRSVRPLPGTHSARNLHGALGPRDERATENPDEPRGAHASHDEPEPRGAFLVTLESGEQFSADTIVNATGTWDRPYIPYIPGIGSFGGRQLHTKDYSAAEGFAGQHVLVVGGGLSAVQFLLELEGIAQTTWARGGHRILRIRSSISSGVWMWKRRSASGSLAAIHRPRWFRPPGFRPGRNTWMR
ncbi:NAD(P)-binding domain-containing protein, partial [Corynebacterium accolens]|uniref:NAD(P)-binding domain-containing protein n=1 Tax=Corynebacterium accolens TaxID=38284 RepID=UPI003D6D59F6